jgi:hypothetical protein
VPLDERATAIRSAVATISWISSAWANVHAAIFWRVLGAATRLSRFVVMDRGWRRIAKRWAGSTRVWIGA